MKNFISPPIKKTSELVIEKWLLENLISCYEEYNLSLRQQAAIKWSKINTDKIKRKMDKLKDLFSTKETEI